MFLPGPSWNSWPKALVKNVGLGLPRVLVLVVANPAHKIFTTVLDLARGDELLGDKRLLVLAHCPLRRCGQSEERQHLSRARAPGARVGGRSKPPGMLSLISLSEKLTCWDLVFSMGEYSK